MNRMTIIIVTAALGIGCIGIGTAVGDAWIVDRMLRVPPRAAVWRTPVASRARALGCSAVADVPTTIEEFSRAARNFPSLDRYVTLVDHCTTDRDTRVAFTTMLRAAAAAADAAAVHALDVLARRACAELALLAGVDRADADRVSPTCADIVFAARVTSDDARRRVALIRLAQLVALVEAGVDGEILDAFCALAESAVDGQPDLPPGLSVTLPRLRAAHCDIGADGGPTTPAPAPVAPSRR